MPRARLSIIFPTNRRKARKPAKITNVANVILHMRDLAKVLRVQYRAGRRFYWLEPGGIEVDTSIATMVITSGNVVPVGTTTLFPDLALPAQTYCYVD
jgi:hypothetical protein